jgi:hypothetical protein
MYDSYQEEREVKTGELSVKEQVGEGQYTKD